METRIIERSSFVDKYVEGKTVSEVSNNSKNNFSRGKYFTESAVSSLLTRSTMSPLLSDQEDNYYMVDKTRKHLAYCYIKKTKFTKIRSQFGTRKNSSSSSSSEDEREYLLNDEVGTSKSSDETVTDSTTGAYPKKIDNFLRLTLSSNIELETLESSSGNGSRNVDMDTDTRILENNSQNLDSKCINENSCETFQTSPISHISNRCSTSFSENLVLSDSFMNSSYSKSITDSMRSSICCDFTNDRSPKSTHSCKAMHCRSKKMFTLHLMNDICKTNSEICTEGSDSSDSSHSSDDKLIDRYEGDSSINFRYKSKAIPRHLNFSCDSVNYHCTQRCSKRKTGESPEKMKLCVEHHIKRRK